MVGPGVLREELLNRRAEPSFTDSRFWFRNNTKHKGWPAKSPKEWVKKLHILVGTYLRVLSVGKTCVRARFPYLQIFRVWKNHRDWVYTFFVENNKLFLHFTPLEVSFTESWIMLGLELWSFTTHHSSFLGSIWKKERFVSLYISLSLQFFIRRSFVPSYVDQYFLPICGCRSYMFQLSGLALCYT